MVGRSLYTVKGQVVRNNVAAAAALGANGVVLGLLTADAEVDSENLAPLVDLCRSKVLSPIAASPRLFALYVLHGAHCFALRVCLLRDFTPLVRFVLQQGAWLVWLPAPGCVPLTCSAGNSFLLCGEFLLREFTPLLLPVLQQGAWPMWWPAPGGLHLTFSTGHNLLLCRILY